MPFHTGVALSLRQRKYEVPPWKHLVGTKCHYNQMIFVLIPARTSVSQEQLLSLAQWCWVDDVLRWKQRRETGQPWLCPWPAVQWSTHFCIENKNFDSHARIWIGTQDSVSRMNQVQCQLKIYNLGSWVFLAKWSLWLIQRGTCSPLFTPKVVYLNVIARTWQKFILSCFSKVSHQILGLGRLQTEIQTWPLFLDPGAVADHHSKMWPGTRCGKHHTLVNLDWLLCWFYMLSMHFLSCYTKHQVISHDQPFLGDPGPFLKAFLLRVFCVPLSVTSRTKLRGKILRIPPHIKDLFWNPCACMVKLVVSDSGERWGWPKK